MKHNSKQKISTSRITPALLVCTAGLLALPASGATITETFESVPTGSFTGGSADLTWVGDTANFNVDTATWPVTHNFNGSKSLRGASAGGTSTVVTDMSSAYNAGATVNWSVFVSGTERNIWPGNYNFSLVLMSDSAVADDIESGSMNGYRLRLGDDDTGEKTSWDTFYFEKATGSGWTPIQTVELGRGADVSEGWNLAASRDSSGNFSWGFANGDYGTPVTLDNIVSDTTTTASTYSGMTWVGTTDTNAPAFGFDEFSVASVPEPSSSALLSLSGLALLLRRRRK